MALAIDGSNAAQTTNVGMDSTTEDGSVFASVLAQANSSTAAVPASTAAVPAESTSTEYDPIPWKPTSEAGVAQGASAGGDAGFGSIAPVQSTFDPGTGSPDLTGWKLTLPVDQDGDGDADEVSGDLSSYSSEYFATNTDGSIFMTTGTGDLATTENSSYGRTELRGMINPEAGDKDIGNNMVLSTAPAADQEAAGAVDGTLTATMSVDQVSETGDPARVGRTVIGQVHSTENEPVKLYFRKLPDNEFGSIFFSHENADGTTEDFYDLIGSRSDTAENPLDGIALGEDFNYAIDIKGDDLTVSVTTQDGMEYSKTIDISESGYDEPGEHMYFKAGAYDQNNTSEQPEEDHVDVTFSSINTEYGSVSDESLATAGEAVDPEEQAANEEAEADAYDEAYEAAYAEAYQSYVDEGYSENDAENLAENDAEDAAENATVGVTSETETDPENDTSETGETEEQEMFVSNFDDDTSEESTTADDTEAAGTTTDSVYQEAYDVAYAEAYDVAYQEAYDGFIADGVEPSEAENQAEDIAENKAEDIAENKAEDAVENEAEDVAEDAAENAAEDSDASGTDSDTVYQEAYNAAYTEAYDVAYQEAYDGFIADGVEPSEAENQAEDIAENKAEDIAENKAEDAVENEAEDVAEDAAENATEDTTENATEDTTENTSEETAATEVESEEDAETLNDDVYATAYQEAYDGFIAQGLDENEAENQAENIAENAVENADEDLAEDTAESALA